jgi:hypothetical protein
MGELVAAIGIMGSLVDDCLLKGLAIEVKEIGRSAMVSLTRKASFNNRSRPEVTAVRQLAKAPV